jgi:DNA-binding transcriptional LysR family regulator
MDTELARTFMMVVSAGNFISAAERLHVTQSTVSARIRLLEEQLGCSLFIRNKAGTTLTPSGKQFQKHAATLVRTVERARQDVGIPRRFSASLTIGARVGLWDQLLVQWLAWMADKLPDTSVRAEIGFEDDLMFGLAEGRIDIGVMYAPQSRPSLRVERLFDEQLVYATTSPDPKHGLLPEDGYVFVDWGPDFYTQHSIIFPEFTGARVIASVGWLGLQHILHSGGAGYFPMRSIRPYVKSGQLRIVPDAPQLHLPAYMVYPAAIESDIPELALDGIRRIAVTMASSEEPGDR